MKGYVRKKCCKKKLHYRGKFARTLRCNKLQCRKIAEAILASLRESDLRTLPVGDTRFLKEPVFPVARTRFFSKVFF